MYEQEREWVAKARQGDRDAFGKIVRAYEKPIYNLTYRMLGNPQEAEDAAQETFLRAYFNLAKYNADHKFSTWLFSIANHHCIDRLRKRRVTWISIDDNPVLQQLEGRSPQPEGTLLRGELMVEVQELLEQLDPDYRTPLILRYWEELSYEEIAQAMDITVAAVKSRLFRARKQVARLYEQLREQGNDQPTAASSTGSRERSHLDSDRDRVFYDLLRLQQLTAVQ